MLGLLVCRSLLLCVLVRVFVYLRGCTCLNLFAELVIVYLCTYVGVLACTCVLSLCAVTLECDKAGKDPAGCSLHWQFCHFDAGKSVLSGNFTNSNGKGMKECITVSLLNNDLLNNDCLIISKTLRCPCL